MICRRPSPSLMIYYIKMDKCVDMYRRTNWSRHSGNQETFHGIEISAILISNSEHSCSVWDSISVGMFEALAGTKCTMTSSNGNIIFCVTGRLWGESTGHRWILLIKARAVTRNFHIFFDPHLNKRFSKQSRRWWFETSLWWTKF